MEPSSSNPFQGWKEYPKHYIAGQLDRNLISLKQGVDKNAVHKLREQIWIQQIVPENPLDPLLPLWSDDNSGVEYLKDSLHCIFRQVTASGYPSANRLFHLFNLIPLVSQLGKQPLTDLLISTLETNLHSFACGLRDSLKSSCPEFRQRTGESLVFLSQNSPQLLNVCTNVAMHLEKNCPQEILDLQLGNRTLAGHIEASRRGDTAPVSQEDESERNRCQVLAALGLNFAQGLEVDDNLVAIVLGDSFVSGSDLNGYNFQRAIYIFAHVLRKQLGEELYSELTRMGDWLKSTHPEATDDSLNQLARTLRTEGRLAIPAGWNNQKGGHAMIAEAILDGKGKATVRLYNQGAGVSQHRRVTIGHRERYDAYLEKTDIPEELVLSPAFWGILSQFKHKRGCQEEPYHAGDIYDWFIHCIPGKIRDAKHLILPQRAGTCPIKAILAFLKQRLTEQEYDRAILCFKFGILAHHEEQLYYRRTGIGLPQKRFLREVRQKLLHSVEVQEKAACIDNNLASLLRTYCQIDLQLDEDKGFDPTVQQLTGTFDDGFYAFSGRSINSEADRNILVKMHSKSHTYNPNERKAKYKFILDSELRSTLGLLLHGSPPLDSRLDYISRLPSLQQIENDVAKSWLRIGPTMSVSCIENALTKLSWDAASTEGRGVTAQILHAWITELLTILVENQVLGDMRQEELVNGELPFTLSLAAGEHPLEKTDSILNGQNQELCLLGERLLAEWLKRRKATSTKTSLFQAKTVNLTNGSATAGIAANFDEQSSFGRWINDASDKALLKDKLWQCQLERGLAGQLYFLLRAGMDSSYTSVNNATNGYRGILVVIGVLMRRACQEASQMLVQRFGANPISGTPRSMWFQPGAKRYSPAYPRVQELPPSSIPQCLPYLGIDGQLCAMEQDHEKIASFQPQVSWFQLSLRTSGDRCGVSFPEAAEVGLTPFCIALQQGDWETLQPRVIALAEQLIGQRPQDPSLCSAMITLVAKVNLRLPKEKRVRLNLTEEDVETLQANKNTALRFARYQLTLPSSAISPSEQLVSSYYLRIRNGLEQNDAFTRKNLLFQNEAPRKTLENTLPDEEVETCWNRALELPGAQQGIYVVDRIQGLPLVDGVQQLWANDWKDGAIGKTLCESLGDIAFSHWKIMSVPGEEAQFAGREWQCPESRSHLIQAAKPNYGGATSILTNGLALRQRLTALGVSPPDELNEFLGPNTYFEVIPAVQARAVPDSLRSSAVEEWRIRAESKSLRGILVSTQARRVYLLKGERRIKIYEGSQKTELLAGYLNFSEKLYFKWCGKVIRIPHLGDTGASIPVEVWGKGRGKGNMQVWLNCLGGVLRFKITRQDGRDQYWSEDHKGFQWDADSWTAELGKLNGLLLTRNLDQILIIPQQDPERDSKSTYRHKWKTVDVQNPYILRRTLHRDLEPDHHEQPLFSTQRAEFYPTLIHELMLQRDWDRALRYAGLIPPGSAMDPKFRNELKEKIFVKLPLDHPKARALRLRILATCLTSISATQLQALNYPTAALSHEYTSYIDQQALLPDGWALSATEEEKLAEFLLSTGVEDRSLIERHLSHVLNRSHSTHHQIRPVPLDELRPVTGTQSVSGDQSTQDPWFRLYRSANVHDLWEAGVKALDEPAFATVTEALLQTGTLWFACRKYPERRLRIAKPIRNALYYPSLQEQGSPSTTCTTRLKEILTAPPASIIQNPELDTLLERLNEQSEPPIGTEASSSSSSQVQPMADDAHEKDPTGNLSTRQKVRQQLLQRRVLSYGEIAEKVRRFLSESESRAQRSKRKAPSSSEHAVRAHKKACSSASSSRLPLATETFDYPRARQQLKPWLERTLTEAHDKQKQLLHEISTINTAGFSLPELYQWLDAQLMELEADSLAARLANLLIDYSQVCSECVALERTQGLLAGNRVPSPEELQRHLSCAQVEDYPMETPLRYRLAAILWQRKLALRPKQLEIAIQSLQQNGCLASVDCGGGKTAVISPLFFNLDDGLVINTVPPGIVQQHSETLNASSESSKGVRVNRVELTRANIWQRLPLLEQMINDAREKRTPLVSTVSDLSALLLAYFETLLPGTEKSRYEPQIRAILKTLKTSGTLLLDEVDTAVKEQVHWAKGHEGGLGDYGIRIFSVLLETLLSHFGQDIGRTEGASDALFTQEQYNELLPAFVDLLIDQNKLPEIIDETDKDWLKAYLLANRGQPGSAELEEPLDSSDFKETKASVIRMLRAVLRVYLPYTLSMRYRVDYGPDAEGKAVVPYLAAKQPDPKYRFSQVHIISLLSIQWRLRECPSQDDVFDLLRKTLANSPTAALASAKKWLGPNAKVRDLRDILDRKDGWEDQLSTLQENILLRLDLAILNQLPKIKVHSQYLQFTVASLEHMMNRVVGLTATPYNKDGMDPRMAANFIPSDSMSTTKALLKRCTVHPCPEPHQLTAFLSTVAADGETQVLIDPNAMLVDYSNKELSLMILDAAPQSIHYMVSWDIDRGEWRAWDRYGISERYLSSKHGSQQCFFFYDQERSRGSDLPLPLHCRAKVLVRQDCTFTDLKQAVERCRQAKEGSQTVKLFVPRNWCQGSQAENADAVIDESEKNQRLVLREILPLMARRQLLEICCSRLIERCLEDPQAFSSLQESCQDLILHKIDTKRSNKLASLKPPVSIEKDLRDYLDSLLKKYSERLLNKDDRQAMEGVVARCLEALDKDAGEDSLPTLDLRVQAIQAICTRQQEMAQQRVQLERRKKLARWEMLWSPQEVLASLAGANQPLSQASHLFKGLDRREIYFVAARISLLLAGSQLLNNLWISSRLVHPMMIAALPKLSSTEPQEHGPLREKVWSSLREGDYVLRVKSPSESQPNQHLLLSAREADQCLPVLRKMKDAKLSLHRSDGSPIHPQSSSHLEPTICATVALFNGRLGAFSLEAFKSAISQVATNEDSLDYLKQRLLWMDSNSPLNFNHNPMVRALKGEDIGSPSIACSSSSSLSSGRKDSE